MMMSATWRYIEDNNQNAQQGLATDEFLTSSFEKRQEHQAFLRLYHYENFTALCGRFQDISSEIDIDFCRNNNYSFSRRLTGGGAIIMGEDQLGICVATHADLIKWDRMSDIYQMFSDPILKVLHDLDIDARFRSKNDLEVNGKKIAGLGVYMSPGGAVQFHCSLLYDLNIEKMLQLLNIPIQKYADRVMVRSVEQRMTTVCREMPSPITMSVLKSKLKLAFAEFFKVKLINQNISESEGIQIAELSEERYLSDDWVFQHSPQQDMTGMSLKKTEGGLLRTYIGLKGENIKSVMVTGDFMEKPEAFSELEANLKWSVIDRKKISNLISETVHKFPLPNNMKVEDIEEAIWMSIQRAHAAHKYTYKGSCYYPKEEQAHA